MSSSWSRPDEDEEEETERREEREKVGGVTEDSGIWEGLSARDVLVEARPARCYPARRLEFIFMLSDAIAGGCTTSTVTTTAGDHHRRRPIPLLSSLHRESPPPYAASTPAALSRPCSRFEAKPQTLEILCSAFFQGHTRSFFLSLNFSSSLEVLILLILWTSLCFFKATSSSTTITMSPPARPSSAPPRSTTAGAPNPSLCFS